MHCRLELLDEAGDRVDLARAAREERVWIAEMFWIGGGGCLNSCQSCQQESAVRNSLLQKNRDFTGPLP